MAACFVSLDLLMSVMKILQSLAYAGTVAWCSAQGGITPHGAPGKLTYPCHCGFLSAWVRKMRQSYWISTSSSQQTLLGLTFISRQAKSEPDAGHGFRRAHIRGGRPSDCLPIGALRLQLLRIPN